MTLNNVLKVTCVIKAIFSCKRMENVKNLTIFKVVISWNKMKNIINTYINYILHSNVLLNVNIIIINKQNNHIIVLKKILVKMLKIKIIIY